MSGKIFSFGQVDAELQVEIEMREEPNENSLYSHCRFFVEYCGRRVYLTKDDAAVIQQMELTGYLAATMNVVENTRKQIERLADLYEETNG